MDDASICVYPTGDTTFPHTGWGAREINRYARRQLALADWYVASLRPGPARSFCQTPLALAYATLDALDRSEE